MPEKPTKTTPKLEETPTLHPKSRKCRAVMKKFKKDTKKEKCKQETKLKQALLAEKLQWFQKHLDTNICPYTVELTAALVEKYINRNDEELEQIKIKRSIGINRNKQHIGRENAICMTKERERGHYESCGLEIPNILNPSQYSLLKNWNGNVNLLPNFKLCHFSKRHLEEELKKQQRELNNKQNDKLVEKSDAQKVISQSHCDTSKTVNLNVSTKKVISESNADSNSVVANEIVTDKMDVE